MIPYLEKNIIGQGPVRYHWRRSRLTHILPLPVQGENTNASNGAFQKKSDKILDLILTFSQLVYSLALTSTPIILSAVLTESNQDVGMLFQKKSS